MCFYLGKNALSTLAFSVFVKELCGSNRSCAFFGAQLQLRTFFVTERAQRKGKEREVKGNEENIGVYTVLECNTQLVRLWQLRKLSYDPNG